MKNCEYCGNEVKNIGKYSSGRFCNRVCANRFVSNQNREEKNKKIQLALKNGILLNKIEYLCEKCGTKFFSKKIRSNYKKHCLLCKKPERRRQKIIDGNVFDISKTTIGKIIKRAKIGCSICAWDEARCDIHHILPKKNGGTNSLDNLIVVCPNCHRKAHENKFLKEELILKSIKNILPNWLEFYKIKSVK